MHENHKSIYTIVFPQVSEAQGRQDPDQQIKPHVYNQWQIEKEGKSGNWGQLCAAKSGQRSECASRANGQLLAATAKTTLAEKAGQGTCGAHNLWSLQCMQCKRNKQSNAR